MSESDAAHGLTGISSSIALGHIGPCFKSNHLNLLISFRYLKPHVD